MVRIFPAHPLPSTSNYRSGCWTMLSHTTWSYLLKQFFLSNHLLLAVPQTYIQYLAIKGRGLKWKRNACLGGTPNLPGSSTPPSEPPGGQLLPPSLLKWGSKGRDYDDCPRSNGWQWWSQSGSSVLPDLGTHFSIVPVRGLLSLKMHLCVFSNSTVTITRNLGVCTCWSHLVEGEPRLEVKCLVWDLIAVECMVELALNFLDSLLPVLFIYYVQGTESRIFSSFLPASLLTCLPPYLPSFFLLFVHPSFHLSFIYFSLLWPGPVL